MLSLTWFLALSAILFAIGTIGVLTRKNAIVIFMSVELMLNAVNLTLVAFSSFMGDIHGQILVFFFRFVWQRQKLRLDWPSLLPSSATT